MPLTTALMVTSTAWEKSEGFGMKMRVFALAPVQTCWEDPTVQVVLLVTVGNHLMTVLLIPAKPLRPLQRMVPMGTSTVSMGEALEVLLALAHVDGVTLDFLEKAAVISYANTRDDSPVQYSGPKWHINHGKWRHCCFSCRSNQML